MIREGKGQVQVEVRNKKRQNEGRDEVVISERKKKEKLMEIWSLVGPQFRGVQKSEVSNQDRTGTN